MSNIYIQEPPTSGKVIENHNGQRMSVRQTSIFSTFFFSFLFRCCWRRRPATSMWNCGRVKHQKHAEISCNCVWKDITMELFSIAWSRDSLHKAAIQMATELAANRFTVNRSKMNFIRVCDSHVGDWLRRPMAAPKTTTHRNSFSHWAKPPNYKISTQFSAKSPATQYSIC